MRSSPAAEILLAKGMPRIALSRCYSAVFHAARAKLFSEGLEPRTHAGVQHLLNVHFARTGHFDAAVSRLLARLQKFREEADYGRRSWSTKAQALQAARDVAGMASDAFGRAARPRPTAPASSRSARREQARVRRSRSSR